MGNSFMSDVPDYLFLFFLFLANVVCVQSCVIFPHQIDTKILMQSPVRVIKPIPNNDILALYKTIKSKKSKKSKKNKKLRNTIQSETTRATVDTNALHKTIKSNTVEEIDVLSNSAQSEFKNATSDSNVLSKTLTFEDTDAVPNINDLSKAIIKHGATAIKVESNVSTQANRSFVKDTKADINDLLKTKKSEAGHTTADNSEWIICGCKPTYYAHTKTKTSKKTTKSKTIETKAEIHDLSKTTQSKSMDTRSDTYGLSKPTKSAATDAKVKKSARPRCTYADVVSNTIMSEDTRKEGASAVHTTSGCTSTYANPSPSFLQEIANSDGAPILQHTASSTPAGGWLRPDPYDANPTHQMFVRAEQKMDKHSEPSTTPLKCNTVVWGTSIVTSRFVRSNVECMTTTPGSRQKKYNQWEPQDHKLDLHDRTLHVAIQSFDFFYARQLQYYEENGFRDQDRYIFVVTGHCRNRPDREAKIKPEIIQILHELHLSHLWFNKGGEVMIELDNGHHTCERKVFDCNCYYEDLQPPMTTMGWPYTNERPWS